MELVNNTAKINEYKEKAKAIVKESDRLKTVDGFLNDIKKIALQIEFTGEPLEIIIDKIKETSALPKVWECMQTGIASGSSVKKAWEDVKCPCLDRLGKEEKKTLDDFFCGLGMGNCESEKKNAGLVYGVLEDIRTRLAV